MGICNWWLALFSMMLLNKWHSFLLDSCCLESFCMQPFNVVWQTVIKVIIAISLSWVVLLTLFKHDDMCMQLSLTVYKKYEGQLKSSWSDIYSLAVELKFFMCYKSHISYKHVLLSKSIYLFIRCLSDIRNLCVRMFKKWAKSNVVLWLNSWLKTV